ncbi:hypothetical protein SAMN04488000_11782 [Lentzea albida]|uniref:Uncharacterized protein n=1 Tax=Lentzea albida TaxID=65499 RepID=A0A1H9V6W7_9PSEU|nr:hypothetical protein SAMN04488000_11782 [Lentzea albida]
MVLTGFRPDLSWLPEVRRVELVPPETGVCCGTPQAVDVTIGLAPSAR